MSNLIDVLEQCACVHAEFPTQSISAFFQKVVIWYIC